MALLSDRDVDVLTILRSDHDRLRILLARHSKLDHRARADRAWLRAEIVRTLAVHLDVEERIVFPALAARVRAAGEAGALPSAPLDAHARVRSVLRELTARPLAPDAADGRVAELGRILVAHIAEEESDLFALARRHFSVRELVALGERVNLRREQLAARALA